MRKWTLAVLALLVFVPNAQANHSWGNYHWARTANPFTLKLGDNLSSTWDPILNTTSTDWSTSSVLDTTITPGQTTSRRCRPTSGQVEVCNYKYGRNGWLGIAQIWVSGDHIVQATTKVNDTYFNTSTYNSPAWRNLVMCQEVGHTLGLDHQDENFNNANLDTCMDYASDPSTNQHPNVHDYEELDIIYSHLDSLSTGSLFTPGKNGFLAEFDRPMDWGRLVKTQGKTAVFERIFGQNQRLFTFVIWAE
ncbi:MAG: hypothetical protein Q7S31_01610 [bacterium]|nr:hypothetical protein [bacterium]